MAVLDALSKLERLIPCYSFIPPCRLRRKSGSVSVFLFSVLSYGRTDVVVNNVGFGVVPEAEGMLNSSTRGLFEVNFWGASYVSKEATRFFREENRPMRGRLLQVSSPSGILATAGTAYYSARWVI